MDLGEELLDGVDLGLSESLSPAAELSIELSLVVLELVHPGIDVGAEDSGSVDLVAVLVFLTVLAGSSGELVGGVGHMQATIAGTLQNGEDLGAIAGSPQTDIEDGSEGPSLGVLIDKEVLAVNLFGTLEGSLKADLLEEASGEEQAGGIGSGIVGQSSGQTESPEFLGVSSTEHLVALEGGVHDLSYSSGGGDAAHQPVFGGVVFVLILEHESLASVVVGLAFSSSLEFGLVAHEVCLVLDELDESHFNYLWINKY